MASNHNGRAYQCLRCMQRDGAKQVIGRKNRVEDHILRKHLSLDEVPFYCRLCLFVTMSRYHLDKHVTDYKAHVRVALERGIVDSKAFLVQNQHPYKIGPKDYIQYSQEDSARIFASRARTATGTLEQVVDNILGQDALPEVDALLSFDDTSSVEGSAGQLVATHLTSSQMSQSRVGNLTTPPTVQSEATNLSRVEKWVGQDYTLSMPTLDELGAAAGTQPQLFPAMTRTVERSRRAPVGKSCTSRKTHDGLRAVTATLTHAAPVKTRLVVVSPEASVVEHGTVQMTSRGLGAVTATPTQMDPTSMRKVGVASGTPVDLSLGSKKATPRNVEALTATPVHALPPPAHSTPVTRTARPIQASPLLPHALDLSSRGTTPAGPTQQLQRPANATQTTTLGLAPPALDESARLQTPAAPAIETENILPQLLGSDHRALCISPTADSNEYSVKEYLEELSERVTKAINDNSRAIRCMEKSLKSLEEFVRQQGQKQVNPIQQKDQTEGRSNYRAKPYWPRRRDHPNWNVSRSASRKRFPSQETELNVSVKSAVAKVKGKRDRSRH